MKQTRNSVSFQEMAEACQAEAIANKLAPTNESTWRLICRTYSQKFNTPLHVVMDLDPEIVLQNYYEGQYEDLDLEEHFETLMDMLYTIEDPEYEVYKKAELEDFIAQAAEEERQRVKAKRPIHKSMKEEATLAPEVVPDAPIAKEGSFLDLSYLSGDDSEGSGFEE